MVDFGYQIGLLLNQQDFSKFIADGVPFRDDVLVINASFQRGVIEFANAPFDYAAYPTFFGSEYVVLPSSGQVTHLPEKISAESFDNLYIAAHAWRQLIEDYPQINWVAYMADRDRVSNVAPVHDLVSECMDRTYWEKYFFSEFPVNCVYIDSPIIAGMIGVMRFLKRC